MRQRIEDLGRSLIGTVDELRRVPCPKCGNQNLQPIFVEQHVIIKCHAPIAMSGETESEMDVAMCTYSQVIYQTTLTEGPFTLIFREPTAKPQVIKTRAPRRRAR